MYIVHWTDIRYMHSRKDGHQTPIREIKYFDASTIVSDELVSPKYSDASNVLSEEFISPDNRDSGSVDSQEIIFPDLIHLQLYMKIFHICNLQRAIRQIPNMI